MEQTKTLGLFMLTISMTLIFPPSASADPSKTWNYSDQFLSSQVTISQEGDTSGDKFILGEASVTLSISNLRPKFFDVVDEYQDIETYGSVLSPNPKYVKVKPDYFGEGGGIFVASVSIWISDNPDFEEAKSTTYFGASADIAMGLAGDVLIDNHRTLVSIRNGVSDDYTDVGFDTFLKKSSNGYLFQLPIFSVKSAGTLYVSIGTTLYERWIIQSRNGQGLTWLSYKDISTSIQVSKLSQEITFTTPQSVPIKNKLARMNFLSTSGLPVLSQESDSSICIVDKNLVHFINSGICGITLSQPGNEIYEAAPEKKFTLTILPDETQSTITCTKGKLTKKVTAVKPKCPSGYKKK
jgi:hypothetical protein